MNDRPIIEVRDRLAPEGMAAFPDDFQVGTGFPGYHGLTVRSSRVVAGDEPADLLAVARCGTGYEKIEWQQLLARGIPTLYAPGANRRGVAQLAMTCIQMGARNIPAALDYMAGFVGSLSPEGVRQVERDKSRFRGKELPERRLGVAGLGATGGELAYLATQWGMPVSGYDPQLSAHSALAVPREVDLVDGLEQLLKVSEFFSIHVPATGDNIGLLNADRLSLLPQGAVVVNCARSTLVVEADLLQLLDSGQIAWYFGDATDPVGAELLGHPRARHFPHLGGGTEESEARAHTTGALALTQYLLHGTFQHAAGFQPVQVPRGTPWRICIWHADITGELGGVHTALGRAGISSKRSHNESNGTQGYTIIDTYNEVPPSVISDLESVPHVIRVTYLPDV